jgi:hypothetical protein
MISEKVKSTTYHINHATSQISFNRKHIYMIIKTIELNEIESRDGK